MAFLASVKPRRVSLPAQRWGLRSSPEVCQSNNCLSTSPCGCRTKAASGECGTSTGHGSLGERTRRCRCTRMLVVPVRACITPDKGSRSPPIAKRKRNFDFIDMNAPRYYERLQEEFKRLHALGWTFRQIAEALDVSERTIVAWRDELDLPRRPRGRKPRKARG